MEDREFDLAGLHLARDEAVAIHQARTTRWQAVQSAALALVGLALFGYLNNALTGGLLVSLVVVAALLTGLAAMALQAYDRALARELRRLRVQVESLKGRRGGRP